jgi:hypothetical protein
MVPDTNQYFFLFLRPKLEQTFVRIDFSYLFPELRKVKLNVVEPSLVMKISAQKDHSK